MSFVETLHAERKARLARIAARAVNPAPNRVLIPQRIASESVPRPPVKRRLGYFVDQEYERAWSIEMLNCDTPPPPAEPIRIEQIQHAVCELFGISKLDLLSDRRQRHLVVPRQIACYLCKKLTIRSLPEIGRKMGDRDHSTVHHSVAQVERLMAANCEIREQVETLIARLGGVDQTRKRHRTKVLTEDDVRAIRASARPIGKLAEQYGVAHATIWGVVKRKTWKRIA